MAIKPFIPYNKRNLNRVSKSILKHLTPDLLPKKYDWLFEFLLVNQVITNSKTE